MLYLQHSRRSTLHGWRTGVIVPRCIDDASIGWWCKYKQNCNISATGVVCLAIIPTKVLDVGDDLAYLNTDRCGP